MSDQVHAPGRKLDEATGTHTVGHEWDGIEELDTPLPRWWVLTFYASILFSIAYVVVYPAIPMLDRGTAGLWNWTSRGALAADMKGEAAKRAPVMAALAETPIEALPRNPQLMRAAIEGGRAQFRIHCATCHGAGAAGSKGYPNLNDDDWLWGGDLSSILFTINHGVRQSADTQTRTSQMPAFGRDGILKPAEIEDLVSHVRVISGQEQPGASSARGAAIFAANCAVCHGADGKGNRSVGAPNLTDAIWFYGGDRATLAETVTSARYGQMPNWGTQLDPATLKMLAAYVHSLGGGETLAAPDAAAKVAADAQAAVAKPAVK